MFAHLPRATDSDVLMNVAAASSRRQVPVDEIAIITKRQLNLYGALHLAAARAIRPWEEMGPEPSASALNALGVAVEDVMDQGEELSVFYQAYSHLANASANEARLADMALEQSGSISGPGSSLLRRLLRFATRNIPPQTVQMFIGRFLEISDRETIGATLAKLAGIEWAVDREDAYRTVYLDSGEGTVDDERAQASRFRALGLDPGHDPAAGPALTDTIGAPWAETDWRRIRDWRRRYVDLHSQDLAWAIAKAEQYRKVSEPVAPYWHPGGLEAAVVTQLRQEADRARSARLWQITDSTAQMALRRLQRNADRPTTPFERHHIPSASTRGVMILDAPFTLPDERRIVGYVWGPWVPEETEGWALALDGGRELEHLEAPQGNQSWTWVTALTCDRSLGSLPFAPYDTLLLRPGDIVEPQARLRDPDDPERFLEGSGRQGRNELIARHVRSLWELLTQHERSSVRVLSEEVHAARPRDQRSDRRRGITDSGQVTTVWVDPDAGEQYRAQRRSRTGSASGYKLAVRYWRGEHERQQCPNSHEHAKRQMAEGCAHDEITIPEHVVGPADAPWSDRMFRARSRRTQAQTTPKGALSHT
ncbi:hypothetical protein ACIBEA_38970 [Streptomyces sp. NPDC051555]|uniref:hypothetical protein n=1 Tax=Streptomyces sp. NPDC051555 TaxID=3365657 RepID=UPI0037B1085F